MRLLVLSLAVAATLVVSRQAGAVGPWLWTANGGKGIAAAGGDVRYVARLAAGSTRVVALRDGAVVRSISIPGAWGLQVATMAGDLTGLSHDGGRLVLTGPTRGEPLSTSSFVVLPTTLRAPRTIELRGDFTVDALSPDGGMLYLVEHLTKRGFDRYQVRAYDLRAQRLLSRVIADKRQEAEVMGGMPVTRVESFQGDRVYTLYSSGAHAPFVHALDTVNSTAICVDLPLEWTDPAALDGVEMRLARASHMLEIAGPNTGGTLRIDTRSGRVTRARWNGS